MEPINSIGYGHEIEDVDHIPFVLSRIFDFGKRKTQKKEHSPQRVLLNGILVIAVIMTHDYYFENGKSSWRLWQSMIT